MVRAAGWNCCDFAYTNGCGYKYLFERSTSERSNATRTPVALTINALTAITTTDQAVFDGTTTQRHGWQRAFVHLQYTTGGGDERRAAANWSGFRPYFAESSNGTSISGRPNLVAQQAVLRFCCSSFLQIRQVCCTDGTLNGKQQRLVEPSRYTAQLVL
jgi:hypothetical protein